MRQKQAQENSSERAALGSWISQVTAISNEVFSGEKVVAHHFFDNEAFSQ